MMSIAVCNYDVKENVSHWYIEQKGEHVTQDRLDVSFILEF